MTEETREAKRKKRNVEETIVPLRRPYMQAGLGIVLCGLGAVFFWHEAETNERGLIINGIIHLGPGGADIFYAAMALFFLGIALALGNVMYRYSLLKPFQIVLSEKWISLPMGPPYRIKEGRLALRDVRGIEIFPPAPAPPERLLIHTHSGSHGVSKQWTSSPEQLQSIAEAIVLRMRQAQDRKKQEGSPEAPSS